MIVRVISSPLCGVSKTLTSLRSLADTCTYPRPLLGLSPAEVTVESLGPQPTTGSWTPPVVGLFNVITHVAGLGTMDGRR